MRVTAIPLPCACAQPSSSHLVQLLTYLHLLPDLNKILRLLVKITGTKIGFQDAQKDTENLDCQGQREFLSKNS